VVVGLFSHSRMHNSSLDKNLKTTLENREFGATLAAPRRGLVLRVPHSYQENP
jgi:hypothetical protein